VTTPLREPTFATEDLPEPDHAYPVILVEHKQHIIWVEADSPKDAVEVVGDDGEWYERIRDSETLSSFWFEVNLPDKYDWDTIYDGGESYQGMRADAHVRSHELQQQTERREAAKAACVAAGHPELRFSTGETYCPNCGYLKAEQLVADIRAAARAGQVTA
jgi:hypothetical protein